MNRSNCLQTAESMCCGHREQDYGTPENNFGLIGQYWTVYTGHLITAADVAHMMVLFKLARIQSGTGTEDSYIDLAGYAACGCEINTRGDNDDDDD